MYSRADVNFIVFYKFQSQEVAESTLICTVKLNMIFLLSINSLKRLELWWQLYVVSLPERDLENIRPIDFCWTECTYMQNRATGDILIVFVICNANALPRKLWIGLETSASEGKLFKLWNMQMNLC